MELIFYAVLAYWFIFMFVALIGYIVNGITYMKLANKGDVPSPWIAWVPYGSYFIGTSLAEVDWYYALIPTGLSLMLMTEIRFLASIGIIIWSIAIDRRVFKRFGKDENLPLLHLIPVIGPMIIGIIYLTIAFGRAKYSKIKEGFTSKSKETKENFTEVTSNSTNNEEEVKANEVKDVEYNETPKSE